MEESDVYDLAEMVVVFNYFQSIDAPLTIDSEDSFKNILTENLLTCCSARDLEFFWTACDSG